MVVNNFISAGGLCTVIVYLLIKLVGCQDNLNLFFPLLIYMKVVSVYPSEDATLPPGLCHGRGHLIKSI